MAELSKVNVNSTDYDLKDQKSRDALVDVVNNGAKNKLKNTATSATVGEVVFTVNDDGTVTAYTTATTAASRSLQIASSGYVDSTDICTGTPDVAYDINTQFGIGDSGNIKNIEPGDAVTAGVSGNIRYFSIYIRAGVNIPQSNAITFRPMICTKAEWDISQAYVPYGKTNRELTVENDSQQSEINYAVNSGAKNALPITNTTSEVSGITFNVNADNTVTSSGTLSSGVSNAVFECSNFQLPAGKYIYSCEGAAQQLIRDSYVQKYNGSSWDAVARDYENNTFTLAQTEQIRVRLRVYSSGTSGTFKPMIRPAAITDPTYEPYAPTNRELYEKVDGLGTELVANTNLNNLNIGTYYCGGATIGATLLNSPTHQPFRLIVSYFQSPTNMMQKIIDFNTSTSEIAIYIRVKTSSGWKSWYKFEGTEVT